MRLIWTDDGRPRARAHGLRVPRLPAVLAMLVAIACGTKDPTAGDAGDTDAATGSATTSTDATLTMSAGPTTQTSTPTSDATNTAGDSTGDASTGEPGTTASDGSSGSGATDTGSSGGSSEGSSSTGAGSDTGTTGGIMSQDCADGCAVEFQCGIQWDSAEECTEFCNANLAAAAQFSPFCMQAWEELSACLGTLDCDGFNQWQAAAMFPYPCYQQDDALAFECDGQ